MSNDQPASGSRWEPLAGSAPDPDAASPSGATARLAAPSDPDPDTAMVPPPLPPAVDGPRRRPSRRRLRLAAASVALLATGGIGGYWLGHTASAASPGAGVGVSHHRDGGPGRLPGGGPGGGTAGGTTGGAST